jgi:hypothetical protein
MSEAVGGEAFYCVRRALESKAIRWFKVKSAKKKAGLEPAFDFRDLLWYYSAAICRTSSVFAWAVSGTRPWLISGRLPVSLRTST